MYRKVESFKMFTVNWPLEKPMPARFDVVTVDGEREDVFVLSAVFGDGVRTVSYHRPTVLELLEASCLQTS